MAKKQTFKIFKGEDVGLPIIMKDDAGVAVDISNWALTFVMRDTDDPSDTAHIEKSTPADILIDPDQGTNKGLHTVNITDADTEGLEAKHYRWSVKRTDSGSEAMTNYGNTILDEAQQA